MKRQAWLKLRQDPLPLQWAGSAAWEVGEAGELVVRGCLVRHQVRVEAVADLAEQEAPVEQQAVPVEQQAARVEQAAQVERVALAAQEVLVVAREAQAEREHLGHPPWQGALPSQRVAVWEGSAAARDGEAQADWRARARHTSS